MEPPPKRRMPTTKGMVPDPDLDGSEVGPKFARIQDDLSQLMDDAWGVDLGKAPVVVVKSTQHFHAGFAPVAAEILYARSPTAVQFEGPENPYRHRDGNYWPLTETPVPA